MRYYLEIRENGHRIPVGERLGYASLKEAKQAAKQKVDDALPLNRVAVLLQITQAGLAGDGGEYLEDESD
jgi:hypothetical protein